MPASADAPPRPDELADTLAEPPRALAEAPPDPLPREPLAVAPPLRDVSAEAPLRVASRSADDVVPVVLPLVMLPLPPDAPLLVLPAEPDDPDVASLSRDVPLLMLPVLPDDPVVAPEPPVLPVAVRSLVLFAAIDVPLPLAPLVPLMPLVPPARLGADVPDDVEDVPLGDGAVAPPDVPRLSAW